MTCLERYLRYKFCCLISFVVESASIEDSSACIDEVNVEEKWDKYTMELIGREFHGAFADLLFNFY